MKIGFSSLVCPSWDLQTIVAKAAEFGFDGVELRGLQGELHLPQVPDLAGNIGATRQLFAAAEVELVCLGTSCSFDSPRRSDLARRRAELDEFIELAAKLGCPFVRIFVGEVGKGQTRESTLARVAEELTRIAPFAAAQKVAVLVENAGDFADSAALWYLCDNVSHPAIRVCWNPCTAVTIGERPTISIPRLGTNLAMLHVCDGEFDESGYLTGYALPGSGRVELHRAIELLKGICFCDYLMFEWPKLWEASLPSAEDALPKAYSFLRERVDERQAVLTAYKGDKKPTNFRSPPDTALARPT